VEWSAKHCCACAWWVLNCRCAVVLCSCTRSELLHEVDTRQLQAPAGHCSHNQHDPRSSGRTRSNQQYGRGTAATVMLRNVAGESCTAAHAAASAAGSAPAHQLQLTQLMYQLHSFASGLEGCREHQAHCDGEEALPGCLCHHHAPYT
jgi:hypothetical protein